MPSQREKRKRMSAEASIDEMKEFATVELVPSKKWVRRSQKKKSLPGSVRKRKSFVSTRKKEISDLKRLKSYNRILIKNIADILEKFEGIQVFAEKIFLAQDLEFPKVIFELKGYNSFDTKKINEIDTVVESQIEKSREMNESNHLDFDVSFKGKIHLDDFDLLIADGFDFGYDIASNKVLIPKKMV